MEQIILEAIYKHIKYKKMTGNGWHRLTEGKSCLINPAAFYNDTTYTVGKGRAVDILHLKFSKCFDMVFHSILMATVVRDRLDRWIIQGVENWLDSWTQRTESVVQTPTGNLSLELSLSLS